MSLREEIEADYIDMYGLVAPYPTSRLGRASDNGVMFTSEYYIMLAKRGEILQRDYLYYNMLSMSCLTSDVLCRVPGDAGQEGPDDYYGVFAACKVLDMPYLPWVVIRSLKKNWGFLNNERPGSIRGTNGKINWEAFMYRQIPLICALYSAAKRNHWYHFPFYWFTALVIATSCMGVPTGNADARRLSWLLIQAVKDSSLLCKWASYIWYGRLYRQYGFDGMKAVAAIYYKGKANGEPHPFAKYWKD